jgi:autotransporter-associated beta strand protein
LNSSGNWSNSANWAGGVIADGAGNTADFSQFDLTNNIVVTVDSSRTIGNLYVGDFNGTHSYTISGSSTLTFDDNSTDFQVHSILQQSSTSHGDTISVPMLIHNDLDINNLSATNPFTISGTIAANTGASSFPTIWFNKHDTTSNAAGNILVSGNISDGTATQLNLVVAHGGTVTLTGTNTYSGFTEVDGGTLLINGNNSAAHGNVYVYSGGTLGGTGAIGGDVRAFAGTVTGATTTTVGTLTMLGNASFATGEGSGGTYLANLSGATSDLLAISKVLTLGSDTTLNIVGTADGHTTYVLATFGGLSSGPGQNMFGTVLGLPTGYDLVYLPNELDLVPVPEPATWIGGALALGAIGFVSRRRFRSRRA